MLSKIRSLQHLTNSDLWPSFEAFFAGNHSDAVLFGKHLDATRHYFRLEPSTEMKMHFKAFHKTFGETLAGAIFRSSDGNDILRQFDYLRKEGKPWRRVLSEFKKAEIFNDNVQLIVLHKLMDKLIAKKEGRPANKPATVVPLHQSLQDCSFEVEKEPFHIFVPKSDADLRKIGRGMQHCVGQARMGYAEKVRSKRSFIFVLHQKEMMDGVCVEVDVASGQVRQAQGRNRRSLRALESLALMSYLDTFKCKSSESVKAMIA